MSFFNNCNDNSGIAGFLSMVERKCEYFMRAGGGALSQDTPTNTKSARAARAAIPEETSRDAVELARTGRYTLVQIARLIGRAEVSIGRELAAAGVEAARGSFRISEARRERFVALARSGLYTSTQIAELTHASKSSVSRLLAKAGVKAIDGRAAVNNPAGRPAGNNKIDKK